MFDLAVRGKMFIGELTDAWVYIKNGKIRKIAREGTWAASATIRLDEGELLLPAATDLHVHLRDWNQVHKESVETGTKAALAGGVTTVAEMPNTEPKLNTSENIQRRVALLVEKSYVDFAVHAGVPERTTELRGFRKAGAFALKLYPPEISRFANVARAAREAGLMVAVHAEENALLGTPSEGRAEEVCVAKLLKQLVRRISPRIAHVSTERASRLILETRKKGLKILIEVTPHHLFVSRKKSRSRIGRASAVRPPLRAEENVKSMVSLLRKGAFDFYATDHAPHSEPEKFSKKPAPGFTGLEIAFPLFLTKDQISRACKLYCENPASYLGIRKGLIRPGYEADLVIFTRRPWRVDPSEFVSRGKVTPFDGERLDFTVSTVIKGGEVVYENGTFRKTQARNVGYGSESSPRAYL